MVPSYERRQDWKSIGAGEKVVENLKCESESVGLSVFVLIPQRLVFDVRETRLRFLVDWSSSTC